MERHGKLASRSPSEHNGLRWLFTDRKLLFGGKSDVLYLTDDYVKRR